jgi:hypothetical protein
MEVKRTYSSLQWMVSFIPLSPSLLFEALVFPYTFYQWLDSLQSCLMLVAKDEVFARYEIPVAAMLKMQVSQDVNALSLGWLLIF